jgi:uncharacterized DUF497 family protein
MTTPRILWDEEKEADNVRKHAVDFREAIEALLDPLARSAEDVEHSDVEQRWRTIGTSRRGRVLRVTTREDGSTIRIISARAATRRERHAYEEA